MHIIIKNSSTQPLYQQIKNQIKAAILSNDLKAGEQLPSIRMLANELHVSVLTTKRVYAELETEGFIVTQMGKGSYVASENMELFRESKRLMVESKLNEACQMAHQLGIKAEDLHQMLDLLYGEENEK
ncbi:MAG: GntR family transcriptional regulator [Sporolactobacillus sp.]